MKFADIKNDIAFKKVFGDMNKKEILISFLNALIGEQNLDKNILDLRYLKSHFLAINGTIPNNQSFFILFRIVNDIYSFGISENMQIVDLILSKNGLSWLSFDHYLVVFIVKDIEVTSGNYYYGFNYIPDKYTGKVNLSYFDCII